MNAARADIRNYAQRIGFQAMRGNADVYCTSTSHSARFHAAGLPSSRVGDGLTLRKCGNLASLPRRRDPNAVAPRAAEQADQRYSETSVSIGRRALDRHVSGLPPNLAQKPRALAGR
jgi:hypothetical protein